MKETEWNTIFLILLVISYIFIVKISTLLK